MTVVTGIVLVIVGIGICILMKSTTRRKGEDLMNKLFMILITLFLVVGCSNNQTPSNVHKGEPKNTDVITPKELALFEQVKKEQNELALKGETPKTVAILYYYAGMQEDYQTEYTLYVDNPDRIQWSLAEHLAFPKRDRTQIENAKAMIEKIKKADFKETSPTEGYLLFKDSGGFQMVKEDGVWKVAFMPIQ